jgi:hypothetical protein
MDLQHVTTIQQRGDDTVVVYVQTEGFNPGQEVEVSVYLTQGSAYATFNDKKRIPLPDQPQLHVELPATKLDPKQDVTVVTRITDVWPTVLQPDPEKTEKIRKEIKPEYMDQALRAVWTFPDPEGKGSGDPGSPPEGNGGSDITTPPQQ